MCVGGGVDSHACSYKGTGLQRDAKHLLCGQISASAESLAFLRPVVTEAVLCMDWPPSHPFAAILSSLIDQLRQKY